MYNPDDNTQEKTYLIRFLAHDGLRYLRAEDVVALIREVADTEETDIRTRLYALANAIKTEL